MTKEPVLILGGRSDIGLAVAHRFAASGHPIQLAARLAETLAPEKADIETRHNVPVTLHEFDVLETTHEGFADSLPALPGIAVLAVGLLGDQAECERDPDAAALVMRSNYEGPALVFSTLANRFEARGTGTLVGISSVAGGRGRASNYVYGSAKAAFTVFLAGLRHRLSQAGVHVLTVLPGFVATKMTEGRELPSRLTATPDEVARAIHVAVLRRRSTIYVKPVWALIMLIVRNLPNWLFNRLKI